MLFSGRGEFVFEFPVKRRGNTHLAVVLLLLLLLFGGRYCSARTARVRFQHIAIGAGKGSGETYFSPVSPPPAYTTLPAALGSSRTFFLTCKQQW